MPAENRPLEVVGDEFELWERHVRHLIDDRGIEELWPPQIQAFEDGVMDDGNFLLVSPPGTGKTLVAEIITVNEWIENMRPSLYLVPYTSLAEEKYREFDESLGDELGLDVKKSTDDDFPEPGALFDAQVLVMTYEKFDSYLRNDPEYVSNLGCVVVDEFHKISDPDRGPNLEIAVTELLTNHPSIKIVGLSATIPNADDVQQWLDGEASVSADWRQNDLFEGIYVDEDRTITFYSEGDEIQAESTDTHYDSGYKENAIIDFLVRETELGTDGQALGFAPRRADAKDTAINIAEFIETHQRSYEIGLDSSALNQIRDHIDELPDQGQNIRILKSCLSRGVGFHHAGLSYRVKNVLEAGFRRGEIKVLIATSTLAAGINLPIKRVFILRPRFGGAKGRDMLVSEYKNLVGRAGRPAYTDEAGEAVLFATSQGQATPLVRNYIQGDIDPLESKIDLGDDHSLFLNLVRNHPRITDILDFLETSFMGVGGTVSEGDIGDDVGDGIVELAQQDMLEQVDQTLQLTSLGEATSKKLVSPRAIHLVRQFLIDNDEIDIDGLLLTIASAPEFDRGLRLWLEGNLVYTKRDEAREELGLTHIPIGDFDRVMATGFVVGRWISEEELADIFEGQNIDAEYWGTGDVRERIVPQYVRILKAVSEVLEETQSELHDEFGDQLELLRVRVKHGLSAEGAEFVRQNVSADRATILDLRSRVGILSPTDLLEYPTQELIMEVGRERALDHKRSVTYSLLDGFERDRELTIIDAIEANLDSDAFKNLLSTDRETFERCVINELQRIEAFHVEEADESGNTYEPECFVNLLTEDGTYLAAEDGADYEIAVECKSRQNLDGEVTSREATEIVQKAPNSDVKLTIGTPDFVPDADDAALDAGVLLLTAPAFGTLMVHAQADSVDTEGMIELFNETGDMSRRDVLGILT